MLRVRQPLLAVVTSSTYTLVADGGTYSYSGNNANTLFNRRLVADGGVYSYSGNNANTLFNRRLVADGGTYTYFGNAADLVYAAGPVITLPRGGDDAARHKRRQREFDDERKDRERLKELIAEAVSGVSQAPTAQVVTREAGEEVVLVPRGAPAVVIPVPKAFDAAEVARMLAQALNEAGVRVREARSAAARERLAREVERALVQLRRRRREEEILLLMD